MFAVFRRDTLNQRSAVDREASAEGNLLSHVGDVIVDACLFRNGIHHDTTAFQLIYSLSA